MPVQADGGQVGGRSAELVPLFLVAVEGLAGDVSAHHRHHIDVVDGAPDRGLGAGEAVPQRRVRLLIGLHHHREALDGVELALEVDLVAGEGLQHDVPGLDVASLHRGRIDVIELLFDPHRARAQADLQSAPAHLVQHADLLGQPHGMVEGRQVDQRSELQPLRALGDCRQEHAGRGGEAEVCAVVFGRVIGIEAQPVHGLDQLQPRLEMLGLGQAAVVHVVENPKPHYQSSCRTTGRIDHGGAGRASPGPEVGARGRPCNRPSVRPR